MSPRRHIIQPKAPVFLGCEGASEVAYGQLLNDFLRDLGLPFHLEVVSLNPGAGDPENLLRRARQKIAEWQNRRSVFRHRFVLIDIDRAVGRVTQIEAAAQDARIEIVWQRPNHEGLLLRHFLETERTRPHDSGDAKNLLVRHWPDYKKGMPRQQLARRIDLTSVRRAASHEADLLSLLRRIRLAE